ncbi:MAG: DUF445 family protein [Planctomycetes bacterium]|nr:DUF445 family protein [Planctomycetota bacterium]
MPPIAWTFPLVGALIGYVTNWLAVRMIFRPRRPIGISFLSFQGVLPRRKDAFARSIASAVGSHLFTSEDLSKLVRDPEVHRALEAGIERRMGTFVDGIKQKVPMAGMFLQGSMLELAREKILEMSEGLLGEIAGHLETSADLQGSIERKIQGFDLDRLEAIVLEVAKREMRFIEVAGGVLGGLVGAAQMLLLL